MFFLWYVLIMEKLSPWQRTVIVTQSFQTVSIGSMCGLFTYTFTIQINH